MTVDAQTWWQFGLALALGLLVGLEREQSGHETGIRTFALIALVGASTGLLARELGGWLVAVGLLVVGVGMVSVGRYTGEGDETSPQDITTVVAALVMYLVGTLLVFGYASVAAALGGTTAVLLHWKEPLHRFARELEPETKTAVYRFALIAVVVLPMLPDRTFGPYEVFNPFRIWLIVALIVGISVAGYIAYKFLGARVGVLLGGVLGGIVSSTATTVAYARRSKKAPKVSSTAAVVIMIASTLAFGRMVVEVMVVAPGLTPVVLPKFGALIGLMTVASVGAYLTVEHLDDADAAQPDDPTALTVAIVFAATYVVILFAVAAAEQNFGDRGMYVVAILSGLTDVDAITLSTAEMVKQGRIGADTGWRMMLTGGLSNVVFKGAAAAVLGARRLAARIAVLFGVTLAGGLGLIWLWPTA